jgi:hypothetical protein
MASTTGPIATSMARGHSTPSSLGTLAPLNTPTRRFYGSNERREIHQEPGVPNPNIYVVQPFKKCFRTQRFYLCKKSNDENNSILKNKKINV